jgi:hypothetical protein
MSFGRLGGGSAMRSACATSVTDASGVLPLRGTGSWELLVVLDSKLERAVVVAAEGWSAVLSPVAQVGPSRRPRRSTP